MYIEAIDLGKSYGDAVVIEHTSFRVEDGESIAFVSPSGSGKSTLLSMIGLLLDPTTGSVVVDGQDTGKLSDDARSELRLRSFGFVFQHTQLIGSLRAWENVATPARFAGKTDFDPKQRAIQLLEQFGLSDRLYHYPHQLSVGQKRRVAVARALMLSPKGVIADEPTNDLDLESATSVADTLLDYADQGNILLYATHDLELAKRADTVMRLRDKSFQKAD